MGSSDTTKPFHSLQGTGYISEQKSRLLLQQETANAVNDPTKNHKPHLYFT